MQYALLIYGEEPTEQVPDEVMTDQFAEYEKVTQHLRDRKALLAGEALQGIATATTVRVVDGRTITTRRSPTPR